MGRRVEKIYVFLMEDEKGNEGVITFVNVQARKEIPALATSEERMMKMIPMADQVSNTLKRPYRVAQFDFFQDVPLPRKNKDS